MRLKDRPPPRGIYRICRAPDIIMPDIRKLATTRVLGHAAWWAENVWDIGLRKLLYLDTLSVW